MKRIFRFFVLLLALALTTGLPLVARAQETAPAGEHGMTLYASKLAKFGPWHVGSVDVGPFYITNSMLVTWIVALAVIIFAQIATRNIREIPEGAQNFWEWLVEGLYGFLEGIIGHDLVRKTFWFFATIFILILFSNWFGLIPGVGSIGWGPASGPFSIIARSARRSSAGRMRIST